MVCEKCWEDAKEYQEMVGGDFLGHYYKLLEERRNNPCSPEQQKYGNSIRENGERGKMSVLKHAIAVLKDQEQRAEPEIRTKLINLLERIDDDLDEANYEQSNLVDTAAEGLLFAINEFEMEEDEVDDEDEDEDLWDEDNDEELEDDDDDELEA